MIMGRVVTLPFRKFGAVCAMFFLTGCSTPENPGEVYDPYESFNRAMHDGNKAADRVFFRPVSQAYGAVVPAKARQSLNNVSANFNGPRNVLNNVLQGDVEGAGHNLMRFLVNSTLGLFGLFDPAASDFGLEEREARFGDTLAVWGTPEGAYLELPFFGPSNERDAWGQLVDYITNPVRIVSENGLRAATIAAFPPILDTRYELGDTVDGILYDSADSYTQLRLFYLESRRFELSGQTSAESGADPYEDLYDDVYEGLYDDF